MQRNDLRTRLFFGGLIFSLSVSHRQQTLILGFCTLPLDPKRDITKFYYHSGHSMGRVAAMSAITPKADIPERDRDVRYVPQADIPLSARVYVVRTFPLRTTTRLRL
jgi:hypothetical protein